MAAVAVAVADRVVVAVVVASAAVAAATAAVAGRVVSASVDQIVVASELPSKECRRRRWPGVLPDHVRHLAIGRPARDHRSATGRVARVVRARRSGIGLVVPVARVRRSGIVAHGQAARVAQGVRVVRRWVTVARVLAARRR